MIPRRARKKGRGIRGASGAQTPDSLRRFTASTGVVGRDSIAGTSTTEGGRRRIKSTHEGARGCGCGPHGPRGIRRGRRREALDRPHVGAVSKVAGRSAPNLVSPELQDVAWAQGSNPGREPVQQRRRLRLPRNRHLPAGFEQLRCRQRQARRASRSARRPRSRRRGSAADKNTYFVGFTSSGLGFSIGSDQAESGIRLASSR